jgi:hypothetical protein
MLLFPVPLFILPPPRLSIMNISISYTHTPSEKHKPDVSIKDLSNIERTLTKDIKII